MSEFKFACPICGQHITADSKDTGSQISCPTCFRKIVVPQAPSSQDPKFVLSASEVNKPRPTPSNGPQSDPIQKAPEKSPIPLVLVGLLVFACVAGATVFGLRKQIFHSSPPPDPQAQDGAPETGKTEQQAQAHAPETAFSGTSLWTLDLSNTKFPETTVSGAIHEKAFALERATLTGSNLTLRVGRNGSIELGLNVYFFNRQAEELSGKIAEVKSSDTTAPRVVLHWMDGERKSETFRNGYAMKVEFGPAAGGSIAGKIFICLPDDSKSWVAGNFKAEIRKPAPPKPKVSSPRSTTQ